VMANLLYDFNAGGTIVPYIGGGVGIAFMNTNLFNTTASSTQFAYQAILGVGYNIDPMIRINLEGRYYGTSTPNFNYSGNVGGTPFNITGSPQNNNVSLLASIQVRFGAPAAPLPPPPTRQADVKSFMVFFDWDRSNLSQQALSTIKQASDQFKATGNARITATGHADRSGPENYNMALSLRRANTVKDALITLGVPAAAITATGVGEAGLLVQTADGVREPQNRRVEVVVGTGQTSSVFSDPKAYCTALSDKYRQYRGMSGAQTPEAAAIYQCEQGNYAAGIPTLEDALIAAKIPLPQPGYRWPGKSYSPS
jgi:OmpA-OmpF porin, OOP family